MSGTDFPSGYRIVEDHDAGAQRIVAECGLLRFICRTDCIDAGTLDGSWRRMNADETSAGEVSAGTSLELDRALRLYRVRKGATK